MTDQLLLTKESLAKALDIKNPAFVDQLVKRGILPEPIDLGGAKRWLMSDIEARINGLRCGTIGLGGEAAHDEGSDPYLAGVAHAAEAAAPRRQGQKQDRQTVSLSAEASGNVTRLRPDPPAG